MSGSQQSASRPSLPDNDPRILELLGLRGDVTLLRQQVRELEAENEQLAAPARQSGFEPSEQPPEDPEESARRAELFQVKLLGIARLDFAKNWALALHLYAAENRDTLPASLADAAPFFPEPDPELGKAEMLLCLIPPGGRGTPPHLDSVQKAIYSAAYMATLNQLQPDLFEIVHHGPLNHVARPGDTILQRERQAWPAGPNSPGLARTYAFVDGDSEIRVEPDGDFSAWEAARLAPTQP